MVNCAAGALTTDRAAAIAARLSLNAETGSEHKGISLSSILKREHSYLRSAMRCLVAARMAAARPACACWFEICTATMLWCLICIVTHCMFSCTCLQSCRLCRPCTLCSLSQIAAVAHPRAVQCNLLQSRCMCGTMLMRVNVLEPPNSRLPLPDLPSLFDCRHGQVCSEDSVQLAVVLSAASAACKPGLHHAAFQCCAVTWLPHDSFPLLTRS